MSHGHRNRIAALAMQADPATVPEGVTPERADSDEPAAIESPAAPAARKAKAKAKRKGARRGS